MRLLSLLLAAAAPSAEAPPSNVVAFEKALAASQTTEAAEVLDKLIAQRTPSDGKPKQDPLLNSLIGRFYLANREPGAAALYLSHAPLAELPAVSRAPTAIGNGRALELTGDRAGAFSAYSEAAEVSLTAADRRQAVLGEARQLLASEPAKARVEALEIANGGPSTDRWQANFLLALSSSLSGDQPSAAKGADQAWTDALSAPLRDLAPVRVAVLRAGLAAARNDVAAEKAMLTASNGLGFAATSSLPGRLPVCGDDGIQPSDFVIFGYVTGPYLVRELFPIAASRTAIVAPFVDALSGAMLLKASAGRSPAGTVLTVSCRTVVNDQFVARPPQTDPMLDWLIGHAIYPASVSGDDSDAHLNAIADRSDYLAARFGKDSPLLIFPRWQTMDLLERRARAGDPVLPGQLAELGNQIAGSLRSAGSPDWIARMIEMRTANEQLAAAAPSDSASAAELQKRMQSEILKVPFWLAQDFIIGAAANFRDEWPVPFAQLVVSLDSNVPADLTARERQSWRLTVAHARRAIGQDREARQILIDAGFPSDACIRDDSEPRLVEQHFSYDDYPDELIAGEQEGAVLFDFGIAPSGAVAHRRIAYSLPSGLFDEASAKGLSSVRYTAPTRSGKATACRGLTQPIVWRLEDEGKAPLPSLNPADPGPTT